MTTRTEQEIRRSAPARGAGTSKSGAGRSGSAAKPVPPPRPAASTLDHADEPRDVRSRSRQGAEPRDERAATSRARRGPAGRARRAEDAGERAVRAPQDGERVSARRGEEVAGQEAGALLTRQGDEVRDGRGAGAPGADGARVRAARPQGARRPGSARRGPARRQRGPFIVLVLGLLGGGLVSLLLLNTVLAQDSIRAGNLKSEIAQLELSKQQLGVDIERRQQPGQIADAGTRQGLEPDWKDPNVITPASEDSSKVGGANR
ncbi:hypothetical protein ACIBEJ_26910 [Nonomuraea sp. NPDC050790]|uniref:hypothetical protein n=1 Tax=Nonomuraea sp. NPDC050790 TaxID=3364371 RepID=UPI0037B92EF1